MCPPPGQQCWDSSAPATASPPARPDLQGVCPAHCFLAGFSAHSSQFQLDCHCGITTWSFGGSFLYSSLFSDARTLLVLVNSDNHFFGPVELSILHGGQETAFRQKVEGLQDLVRIFVSLRNCSFVLPGRHYHILGECVWNCVFCPGWTWKPHWACCVWRGWPKVDLRMAHATLWGKALPIIFQRGTALVFNRSSWDILSSTEFGKSGELEFLTTVSSDVSSEVSGLWPCPGRLAGYGDWAFCGALLCVVESRVWSSFFMLQCYLGNTQFRQS